MTALKIEKLKALLDYEPHTGTFKWRVSRKGGAIRGDQAGSVYDNGYRYIRVDNCKYFAHRLAWFYTHGTWPQNQLDHRNGNRDDNRIANLREATHPQNQQNRSSAISRSAGLLGTRLKKGRWEAAITSDGVRHYLGRFSTTAEAHAAYLKAKSRLHVFQPSTREAS